MTVLADTPSATELERPSFLWLEVTTRCQLACQHCYADASPSGGHGTMTDAEWRAVIDQAAAAGVGMAQFIGGEPSLHPGFVELVEYALAAGLVVEIYSNLYHVPERLWRLYSHPNLGLATSYYSDAADEHDAVTMRRGSHARTRANIVEALRRGIPIRVSVIDLGDGQRVAQARAELAALGVASIGVDRVRAFGRGGPVDEATSCGQCGHGAAAILPDGRLAPCVLTRHRGVGDVRRGLAGELVGEEFIRAVAVLDRGRGGASVIGCGPYTCAPDAACKPSCTPSCMPLACSPR